MAGGEDKEEKREDLRKKELFNSIWETMNTKHIVTSI